MRVLHVGFGFRPWIVNGLVIYSESVMDGQVRMGHDVGYFFAGRQLPFVRRLLTHRYGDTILRSLPPARRIDRIPDRRPAATGQR